MSVDATSVILGVIVGAVCVAMVFVLWAGSCLTTHDVAVGGDDGVEQ